MTSGPQSARPWPPRSRHLGDGRQSKPKAIPHPTVAERVARGKAARAVAPRSGHGEWEPAGDRPDPVELLEEQAASRVRRAGADPLRTDARVAVHVFSRRGLPYGERPRRRRCGQGLTCSCAAMRISPTSAPSLRHCRLVFSINDFDETLPGPFEWDVKRQVAFAVAGRDRGFDAKQRGVGQPCGATRAYREAIRGLAALRNIDLWYSRIDVDEIACGT